MDEPNQNENQKQQSQLNSPELNQEGKPTRRAIDSAEQAYSIAKTLRQRAIEGRIDTAAQVASRYNADAPFNQRDLTKTGQDWRNNFSTNFLGSIVDRVIPQLSDPLSKAQTLTHSALPAKVEKASEKTRTFREKITRTVRAWNEWKDFVSGLARDNTLFGNVIPARMSDDWRPRLWRYDETFLPEGTKQNAESVQVAVFYDSMAIHDFLKIIEDPKIAEKAGYDVEGCIKSANCAKGTQADSKDPTPLEEQDRVREGVNLAFSIENQTKTVNLCYVVAHDYTGEVDLWVVNADDGTKIREVKDLHKGGGMTDAMTLFTFQAGNRKFYGSKGLGRLIANIHTAIERGRCLGADQMYLSGLVIIKSDKMDVISLQTKVRHPFIFLPRGMDVVAEQIKFNHETFLAMDQKLVELAESIAGAFIPPNLNNEGSSSTKIEAAQKAARDETIRQGVLGRFFGQVYDLIGMMQRAICSPINLREAKRVFDQKKKLEESGTRTIMRKVFGWLKKAFGPKYAQEQKIESFPDSGIADEEAVNCIVAMLGDGLTCEEIATLALAPAQPQDIEDATQKDQMTLMYIQSIKGNPYFDQREANEMEAILTIGEDRANQLLMKMEDPNVKNTAIRQQTIEFTEMMAGEAMPVVATDNHKIHREVLADKLNTLMQVATSQQTTPQLINSAKLGLSHYLDHIGQDTETSDEEKKQEEQHIQTWMQSLEQTEANMQQLTEQQKAQGAQVGPDGLPIPVEGQPPQVNPEGQIDGDRVKLDAANSLADIDLRTRESDRLDSEHALDREKFQHQQEMDLDKAQKEAVKLQQGNLKLQADAENKQADHELRKQTQNQPQE